MLHIWICLKSI